MNPADLEARMLANTAKRLFEYADKAYVELRRLDGRNDDERKNLNAARLYIASARSAAEVLYDLYVGEQPAGGTTDERLLPPQPEEPGVISRIWNGLKPR